MIIDMHTHLRNDIPLHTNIAKQSGIDVVVYMANTNPPLDRVERIKSSLNKKRYCKAIPVSAMSKNLEGKEVVDVDKIKPLVVGFSDDGYYARKDLVAKVLKKDALVLAHCGPDHRNPNLSEVKAIKKTIDALRDVGKGRLHIQHVSRKESVDLIRNAKKEGLSITSETCPHYFTYTKNDLDVKVNPPLATEKDLVAIKEGLADETIDVIASDYAPIPRKTGIAGFRALIPLSYGLVLEGILSKRELWQKLSKNPRRIIEASGFKL